MAGTRPILIVVSGPPASGKSAIARELERRLPVPAISKDDIKETLYDTIGHGEDVEERLEDAALTILFRFVERLLESGYTPVIESDFDVRSDTRRFRELRSRTEFALVQVHVSADHDVIVQRFCERAESGTRHPGHDDTPGDAAELRQKLDEGLWAPLALEGATIELDVTEFDVDYEGLVDRIREAALAAA
jgi:predicted kinase